MVVGSLVAPSLIALSLSLSLLLAVLGTPRQGRLVPSSRSIVHLKVGLPARYRPLLALLLALNSTTLYLQPNMSPEALDGLEGFSHVWLSFKFHLNTNTLDEAKAFQGVAGSNQKFTFTAKITPPVKGYDGI